MPRLDRLACVGLLCGLMLWVGCGDDDVVPDAGNQEGDGGEKPNDIDDIVGLKDGGKKPSERDGATEPERDGSTDEPDSGPNDVDAGRDGSTGEPDSGSFGCGNGTVDTGETCDNLDNPCCNADCDGPAPATKVCRASAGACDVVERCDGATECPADALADDETPCRAAGEACDATEYCDGESADCPEDGIAEAGTECRAATGTCDIAEACDGESTECPANARVTSGTECRAANGDCDIAEECDGVSGDCPADLKLGSSTICRAGTSDCDADERCDGEHDTCPVDAFADETTICRAGSACDAAETCTGTGPACPADVLEGSGTVCRGAASECDIEETCDGLSAECPADVVADGSVTCRSAVDSCDAAEVCDGQHGQCPSDLPSHCAFTELVGDLPLSASGDTTSTCATYTLSCAGSSASSNEQVFGFTAPANGTYRFDTFGSAFDTIVGVLDGMSCGASDLGCDDDVITGDTTSALAIELSEGQRVLVVVDGYGASGAFQLHIREASELAGWTCSERTWGGNDGCHCGCGVVDPDCDTMFAASCDNCVACYGLEGTCGDGVKVEPDNNAQCTGWLCPNEHYGSGDGCDCGCGILDPDCNTDSHEACMFCNACGDRNTPCEYSATVEANANSTCTTTWQNSIPGDDICEPAFYGAGDGCDCGCGIFDPDCATDLSSACRYCGACGAADCSDTSIDFNANSLCAPETPGWTCNPNYYDADDGCDCGCGVVDPDCSAADASACDYCEACRDFSCLEESVVTDDNSRCL